MKKLLCFILCGVMLLSLAPAALAAEASSGLSAFTDKKQYAAGTFEDVASGAWYEASVKTVYDKGIMDGVGKGAFVPGDPMPWSQAVTIAARLHAAYQGKTVPAAEGKWYAQYLSYARENGLLPAICPDEDGVDATPITREGLAVLFRGVLDEKDLPAVNDQSIPDLNEVREEYRDAVKAMFASGIFTGKNGLFDPDGQATRAEVATIVARLLCPGQRVSHDSRQNPSVGSRVGPYSAIRVGDTVYYSCTVGASKLEDIEKIEGIIVARTDAGELRTVYSGVGIALSAEVDGMLYFIQEGSSLRRLDLKTNKAETIYTATTGVWLRKALFYDGQTYLLTRTNDGTYQVGRLEGGQVQRLTQGINMHEGMYMEESLYAFGGKLYWIQLADSDSKEPDCLMSYDLKTQKTSSVPAVGKDIAYQGATAYVMGYTNGNFPYVLRRFSLAMPDMVETVGTYSGEYAQQYLGFGGNGSLLYFYASDGEKVWTISPSGETTQIAAKNPYASAVAFSEGVITSDDCFITLDGKCVSYTGFLGYPHYYHGKNVLTATENDAAFDPVDDPDEDVLYFYKQRAYVTPEGDVALEMKVGNSADQTIWLAEVGIKLSGGATAEECFHIIDPVIKPGQSDIYTFVFPRDRVSGVGDMADLEIEDLKTVSYFV